MKDELKRVSIVLYIEGELLSRQIMDATVAFVKKNYNVKDNEVEYHIRQGFKKFNK